MSSNSSSRNSRKTPKPNSPSMSLHDAVRSQVPPLLRRQPMRGAPIPPLGRGMVPRRLDFDHVEHPTPIGVRTPMMMNNRGPVNARASVPQRRLAFDDEAMSTPRNRIMPRNPTSPPPLKKINRGTKTNSVNSSTSAPMSSSSSTGTGTSSSASSLSSRRRTAFF
jgi:hypothetical protein